MREIKFRAWHEKDKQMLHWHGMAEGGFSGKIEPYDFSHFKAPRFKWMQYTGLKDATGKEIYEGDVVMTTDVFADFEEFRRKKAVIEHCTARFRPREIEKNEKGGRYWLAWNLDDIEVIGNIYENPKLLTT
jgi:uncharacterized phage protein (TIGR01671 family)